MTREEHENLPEGDYTEVLFIICPKCKKSQETDGDWEIIWEPQKCKHCGTAYKIWGPR